LKIRRAAFRPGIPVVGVPAWFEANKANAALASRQDKKQNSLATRESPFMFITHKANYYPEVDSFETTSATIHLSIVNKTFLNFVGFNFEAG